VAEFLSANDPLRTFGLDWMGMAEIGQKWSLAGVSLKVCLRIKKETFEPIAAARNDLLLGYVGFGISKRKQLIRVDFVA
jgi:hypothetical protein